MHLIPDTRWSKEVRARHREIEHWRDRCGSLWLRVCFELCIGIYACELSLIGWLCASSLEGGPVCSIYRIKQQNYITTLDFPPQQRDARTLSFAQSTLCEDAIVRSVDENVFGEVGQSSSCVHVCLRLRMRIVCSAGRSS